ncbi:uncharacterized protein LOC124427806 isoform X3 [Vespa crabro]|uniref:uncharacterized protein LOC124427806 isoform X3 n=1 Tax=Vespa crabro TaxID=7445 RepID=UPI001F01BF3F|nr:uncharacterized protein LOC124427806 isoform X3 [Vespa crabro]
MSTISVATWLLGVVALTTINNGVHCQSILHGSSGKNGGDSSYQQNSLEDLSRSGPYFDKSASKNVTALLGKTTYLNCRVKNLGNKTMTLQVSWVRHRDIHLLTIGQYTYTNDQRFRAIHKAQSEDWTLQIKYPQHRDSGIYECQVSTTPHMSHFVHLNVIGSRFNDTIEDPNKASEFNNNIHQEIFTNTLNHDIKARKIILTKRRSLILSILLQLCHRLTLKKVEWGYGGWVGEGGE